jgi:RecB family endonuclease NucS
MAKEIKTWEIVNDELKEIESSLIGADRKEKEHLEKWIKTNPKILGGDIIVIGEQVYTKSGPLDFLGIDNSGNTVIVELKRDKLPRDVLTQVIDYASDVATWDIDKLSEVKNNH